MRATAVQFNDTMTSFLTIFPAVTDIFVQVIYMKQSTVYDIYIDCESDTNKNLIFFSAYGSSVFVEHCHTA